MKKSFAILFYCMIFLTVTGCGSVRTEGSTPPSNQTQGTANHPSAITNESGKNSTSNLSGNSKSDSTSKSSPKQEKSIKIQIYYTDANLMQLLSEEKKVSYHKESEKYALALKLLEKPTNNNHVQLFHNFGVHKVSLQKGLLTIDVNGKNVYNLGSSAEEMAIKALLETMFQFPEVNQVKILIDGKQAESFAGHVDISQPFTRDK